MPTKKLSDFPLASTLDGTEKAFGLQNGFSVQLPYGTFGVIHVNNEQGTLCVIGDQGALELGIPTNNWTPYIDFHSSSSNNDYDSRIVADGGTSGSKTGTLSILSENCQISGTLKPTNDDTRSLGDSTHRWTTVYATTGTINTSDEREKEQIRDLSESEKNAAIQIKNLIKTFKFKDAVKLKGSSARIHIGVIAQEVAQAFIDNGLNPDEYALFCYDEWEEQPETTDNEGSVISPKIDAGNRYGIRYEELMAFIISAL